MATRSDIPRRFFNEDEQARIVAAITAAEERTTGEIRVFIERDVKDAAGVGGDPCQRAREVFAKLGMHATAARNGVLVYLAVRARRFAIVGDEELHLVTGEDGWVAIRDQLAADFAAARFLDGLTAAIAAVGERLRRHFPPRPDDRNELPDVIAY